MKLRINLLVAIVAGLTAFYLLLFSFSREIILEGFARLDEQQAQSNLRRVENFLDEELGDLNEEAVDEASRDATYAFIERGDARHAASDTLNLGELEIDFALFVHASGRIVLGRSYDPGSATSQPAGRDLLEFIAATPRLWRQPELGGGVQSLVSLPAGPALLVAQPILHSDGTGPARGALVLGRYLDAAELGRLERLSQVSLSLESVAGPAPALPAPTVHPLSDRNVTAETFLPDLSGAPRFLLKVVVPNYIARQGEKTVLYFMLAGLALGVMAGGLLYWISARLAAAKERHMESERLYQKLSGEFQALLDGIPDSLSLVDFEGRMIWGNRATARLMALPQEQLPGKFCRDYWHSAEPCTDCAVQKCFRSGRTVEGIERTADGKIWGIKAFPLNGELEAVTGVIRLACDITEKIRLREKAARASHLASLGELAAGVAHEVNNPNGLILLNMPVLQEAFAAMLPLLESCGHDDFRVGRMPFSRMKNEIPRMLEQSLDGARRIRRIVDDLKNFVRQEDPETAEEFSLNQALDAALRLTDNFLKKSTNRLTLDCEENLPRVRGSAQRIEQVLVNLLMNACQALPSREHGVRVTARHLAAEGKAFIQVSDEGAGIAPENLPHITDPFFTTKRDRGGTGLGLSVSARIVKLHGGCLDFASILGKGTTATLTLPAILEGATP